MRRRLLVLALALACVLSLFAGCGQNAASGEGKDTVTFLSYIKSESFDPTTGLALDKSVMHCLHDTLVAFGPDGDFIPMLAESWEEAEDGMSITFHLRDDVTFHNGDPLHGGRCGLYAGYHAVQPEERCISGLLQRL